MSEVKIVIKGKTAEQINKILEGDDHMIWFEDGKEEGGQPTIEFHMRGYGGRA